MNPTRAKLTLYLSVIGGVVTVFLFNLLVFSPLLVKVLNLAGWFWPMIVSALMTIFVFAAMWDPCTHKISNFKHKHGID